MTDDIRRIYQSKDSNPACLFAKRSDQTDDDLSYPVLVSPDGLLYTEDYRLKHAIDRIYADTGDIVSVDQKRKDLLKFGENTSVSATKTTIMTLPTGLVDETIINTNGITTMISSSNSDVQNLRLLEGHTISGTSLTFTSSTTLTALTGQTASTLPIALARITRARLSTPAVGDIYFYEGGATSGGVPTDLTKVHMMIPAGEIQSQKASTAVSSVDYWIITGMTGSVLSKQAAWAQVRIEIKPATDPLNSFYPITQWIGVTDASGTISRDFTNYKIVPKNHDVRLVAIANTNNIYVAGGIEGYLAIVT